jgi:hypothetical protein
MILSDSDADWLPIFGLLASILGHVRIPRLTRCFKVHYDLLSGAYARFAKRVTQMKPIGTHFRNSDYAREP